MKKERISKERQKEAGRELVVLLGGLLSFLLGLIPAVYVTVSFHVWLVKFLGYTLPLRPVDHPFLTLLSLIILLVGTVIFCTLSAEILWFLIAFFFLSKEEVEAYNELPQPYIPILTPLNQRFDEFVLRVKIRREENQ